MRRDKIMAAFAEPRQLFRVTLRRWDHMKDEGLFFNPFRVRDIWRTRPCTERVWEFEARDEAQVRAFYEDAKKKNLPNVHGFDLIRIEKI